MKRSLRWTIAGLAVLVITGVLAHHFLWIRAYKAEVSCAGRRIANAHIYRNRGSVLVVLREPSPGAYLISARGNAFGIPMSGFWLKTGMVIGLPRNSVAWVSGSNGYDPKLRLSGSSADFEDFDRHSYHLQW